MTLIILHVCIVIAVHTVCDNCGDNQKAFCLALDTFVIIFNFSKISN